MSTDPNSGIALVTMYDSANGQLSNGEQFTGVLIAPDEILTVAHGVTDPSGNIRNSGTAYLGHDGGTLTGGDAISAVHVLDDTHLSGGTDDDQQVTTDFAVLHLSQPVTGATTFSLGTGTPGTYAVAGYPAVEGGKLTSVTEALSQGTVPGELTGAAIVPGQSGEGASGSPVYSMVGGSPTVSGILTSEDFGDQHNEMLGLTQGQVDQIKAWVYSDDASQPWGAAFAPTPASAGTQAGGTGASSPTASPAPTDRFDVMAADLTSAAAQASGPRAATMTDVATALTTARQEGYGAGDIPDGADEAANLLQGISATPRRAVAFMVGMLVDESGVARGRIAGYAASAFGIQLGKTGVQIALRGYATDRGFGSQATGAPIPTPSSDGWSASGLAAALAASPSPAQVTDACSPVLAASVPTLAASHVHDGTGSTSG